MSKNRYNFI